MAVLTPAVAGIQPAAPGDDARQASRERLAELGARATTSALFVVLAVRIGAEFVKTGHLTGLLLLVSELLVVALTVLRRPAVVVDRALWTRIIAGISMVGIPLIRPTGTPLAPDPVTAAVSAVGLLVLIADKLTLGRSFGLMPANRGIVCRGIYRVVRHPIYAGYLITHAAFLAAHPEAWNLALILVSDTALLVRATYEERTLALDPEYAAYLTRVRWRVAPGLF
jgi:protein-S-isoprenylcysteine O-methyltransferase Ste14